MIEERRGTFWNDVLEERRERDLIYKWKNIFYVNTGTSFTESKYRLGGKIREETLRKFSLNNFFVFQ